MTLAAASRQRLRLAWQTFVARSESLGPSELMNLLEWKFRRRPWCLRLARAVFRLCCWLLYLFLLAETGE